MAVYHRHRSGLWTLTQVPQPNVAVEIDWTHPLANGLGALYLPGYSNADIAQQGLPNDLNILRTTSKHNNSIAGIRTSVLQEGIIRYGDSIWLE